MRAVNTFQAVWRGRGERNDGGRKQRDGERERVMKSRLPRVENLKRHTEAHTKPTVLSHGVIRVQMVLVSFLIRL